MHSLLVADFLVLVQPPVQLAPLGTVLTCGLSFLPFPWGNRVPLLGGDPIYYGNYADVGMYIGLYTYVICRSILYTYI